VPLAKLCPRKFSNPNITNLTDNTDTESRNSNSSICSQTTNDEEDEDFSHKSESLASSTEKLPSTQFVSSPSTAGTNPTSKSLEICVDCYQLMISLKVTVDTDFDRDELNSDNESEIPGTSNLARFISSPFPRGNRQEQLLKSPETPLTMSSLGTSRILTGSHSTPTPIP